MTVLINPQVPEADKEKVNAIFKSVEEHLGFVPDGLKLFAISPTLLENFVGNVGYFMSHPELSQDLLAMIRYLVSAKASGSFCTTFNAAILTKTLNKTEEQLQAAQADMNNAPLTEAEIVLLKIALKSIEDAEGITQDDIQKARDAGFSDCNIFDAVTIAANNNAFTQILKTFNVNQQGLLV